MKLAKVFFFSVGWVFLSCEAQDAAYPEQNGGKFLSITTEVNGTGVDDIKVGVRSFVKVEAHMTKDATNETCTFTATHGTFGNSQSTVNTTSSTVDVYGKATTYWFPPETPGIVIITAKVKTVEESLTISVTPVPEVLFEGVPDSIQIDNKVLFIVSVDQDWAGSALELKTTLGTLSATGPVMEERGSGRFIKPLLDQTGKTQILFQAPSEADEVVLTGSLFGTTNSVKISVRE